MPDAPSPPRSRAIARDESVLGNQRFRRIWAAGSLTSMMRWLDLLVLGVFTFDLTDSATKVVIVLLVRMLPRFAFGILLGTLADRVNRKHLWVTALTAIAVVALTMAILISSGAMTYGILLVVVFVGGIFWAMEFPVRRAMIGDVVPDAALGRAIGTDWTTDSFNRMVGPALGGALIITVGAEGGYFLMAGMFALAALVALSLDYTPHVREAELQSPLQSAFSGLRHVRASRLLVGVMLVTVLFNLVFFPYQAMIPVIGKDILGANALRVGLLSSVEGFGALLGALWIANRARPRMYPRLYYYGTLLFCVCALAFSRSETYAVSILLLFIAGFGFTAFATMQTTILVRATSVAMRGRVLGVLSLSIGAGPLGALQVAPLTGAVGNQTTLTILVVEGLVMLVIVGFVLPVLRRTWAPSTEPGAPDGAAREAPAKPLPDSSEPT